SLLNSGDHVVMSSSIYAPTRIVMEKHWSRFGVECSTVDTSDLGKVEGAMKPNTTMVFIETPANPMLTISDIAGCAAIAHKHGALLVVDSTFMSPILQRPIEHGADIVHHSVTKFINGHTDVVGGMLIYREEELYDRVLKAWYTLGGTMDPHQSWLVLRGTKTLKMRVLTAQEGAIAVADFLEGHSAIGAMHYPGLGGHPGREVHERQADGPGSLISFELEGGLEAGARLLDRLQLMTLAVSLGGIETLIQHPASMTHAGMSQEQRLEAGITDGLVRLSVGCEDAEDLIEDLRQALV
ncbi:PLP-dependent transferase, partial [bacterium]|nr:PLP-dependent transferase [bacterium]